MAKKGQESPATVRLNLIIDSGTVSKAKVALAVAQHVMGVHCSLSQFFEIAANELVKRPDIGRVLRTHGAKARRDKPKAGR